MERNAKGPAPLPEVGSAQGAPAGDGGPGGLAAPSQGARFVIPRPQITPRLLAVITVLVVIGALKLMAEVLLPLAFGLFLVAIFWPLQKRLQHAIGRGPGVVVTLLVFLAVVVAFGLALYYCYVVAARQWPHYAQQFDQYLQMAEQYGVSLPGAGEGSGGGATEDLLMRGLERTAGFFSAFTLVTGYLILGLLEVVDFRRKLRRVAAGDEEDHWLAVVDRITYDFQRYIVIRTIIGLITGVLVGLGAWLIGLDLAYIWGVTAFLLNYIPTIGTIIAMVPPVLFGLVQGGVPLALWALGVLGGIQTILGIYVDPMLQGRYLTPSPLVVLVSVAFWGWLWGSVGAFIGVPLTMLGIIACRQFERTRWISILLADMHEIEEAEQESTSEAMALPSKEGEMNNGPAGEPVQHAAQGRATTPDRADVHGQDRVSTGGQSWQD